MSKRKTHTRKLHPIDYEIVIRCKVQHEPSDTTPRHYNQLKALLEDLIFCGDYGALRIAKVVSVKEVDRKLEPYG